MRNCFIGDSPRHLSATSSALLLVALMAGCHSASKRASTDPNGTAVNSSPASGTIVLTGAPAPTGAQATFRGAGDLSAAEDLYLEGEWKKAAKLFGKVADDKKNPPLYGEKARFFEGECKLMINDYVDAMATFNRLLIDFQYGVFREKAVGRMFDIANFWLNDTRAQFDLEQEKADGKRWFVPYNFVHFEKNKPFLDQEGHALKMLEQVFFNDPTGPHADKALFMAGYVHYRRGNYREADQILTALLENIDKQGKKSEYRDRALELAIFAKRNSIGGPHYDGRKVTESLKLVQDARLTSPELAKNRGDFLDKQVEVVRYMQAEKDFEIAEFYARTGHPASAWFYYELVRRRYQGTEFHDKAVAHMKEIRDDLAAQPEQPAYAKAVRREWNKWAFGHEPPILAANTQPPVVPGTTPDTPANPITPVSGKPDAANGTVQR